MKKVKQNVKSQNKKIVKKVDNNKKTIVSNDNEMMKLIILILIVAVVFGIFYVITLFVTKDETTSDLPEESYSATIQYDEILAGNIFDQKDDDYYVLVYYPEDQYVSLYMSYLSYYEMTVENATRYYTVNMSDVFNNQFVADESVLNVTDSKDFRFSQTALLRIKNGKVYSTYETKDIITAKFGRMIK